MDLDDEELKATRKLNGTDKDVGSMEEKTKAYIQTYNELKRNRNIVKGIDKDYFFELVEHLIKAYKELEYKYNKALSDLVQAEHKNKELEEENKELISDNLDYQRTLDIFDKRTYRKKYLEERRKEEPNLLYPDADEIYKRYYKLREENKELKKDNKRYEKELHDVIEFSIPVSLVKEKIEELEIKMEYENNEKVLIWLHKQRSVLQELLEE